MFNKLFVVWWRLTVLSNLTLLVCYIRLLRALYGPVSTPSNQRLHYEGVASLGRLVIRLVPITFTIDMYDRKWYINCVRPTQSE